MNRELLEKFVELSPKDWNAGHRKGSNHVHIGGFGRGLLFVVLESDHASAEAIVWLWDYLKPADIAYCGNRPEAMWSVTTNGDTAKEPVKMEFGATRIEALVRTCISKWESQ